MRAQVWCSMKSCTRRVARAHDSGLCHTHHLLLSRDKESPLALVHGEWVRGVAGVRTWRSQQVIAR